LANHEDVSVKILVVGGVAAGASAAVRARRLDEKASIVLFERGAYISFANCGLPYHVSGVIPQRSSLLVQTPEAMRERFNIDVRIGTEIVQINRQKKTVLARKLSDGSQYEESYDFLVLSPGAEPLRPPLPGVDSGRIFTLRNIPDMDAVKDLVDGGTIKRAVIVGGGYIGLEMCEALRERKIAVTMVEMRSQVMEPSDPEMAAFLHREIMANGVTLCLNTAVRGFRDQKQQGLAVDLANGDSILCDLVILAIGVRPEVHLAKDCGLGIGARGGILVDEFMRTSDPSILAAGDAVEIPDFLSGKNVTIPLAGPANRQGRIAADAIFSPRRPYKGTQGTAICKVFGLTIGMTGWNEKQLKGAGTSYEKIYIHPSDHAGYYPGAVTISIKLLFDPVSGKMFGAQAVGTSGIDKRIDVLAVAIRAGLTVRDLQDLELSYAPPYNSAKDPVNQLGFVASNLMDKLCLICHVSDIQKPSPDQIILDVRQQDEFIAGAIPGALNIPLDSLRNRLSELPKDKEILVYCKAGFRGYIACRILMQNALRCRNLSGGYLIYQAVSVLPVPSAVSLQQQASRPAPRASLHLVDACGLQCPGPIVRLKQEIDRIAARETLQIQASDPGFATDVVSWCQSMGHDLLEVRREQGKVVAVICKGESRTENPKEPSAPAMQAKTIVVFSSELDKVLAAFVIASGAAAMGSQVTMFFTFWGLNALRKPQSVAVKKNPVEMMLGWMMPRGADQLVLSKMHMAGAGTWMIKQVMKHKNVSSLPEMIELARHSGVKFVACAMSMDLMGIKPEELIEGVQTGGVANYLQEAQQGNVNLFI
jgi:NADPH-dependent 2,4-dienoyl-CoA reductase/sulfur reductase-like enzyme/peroxiredoxin family protein/rhodanese-related sulfurtransferase/TusA-related sulfurtransferase